VNLSRTSLVARLLNPLCLALALVLFMGGSMRGVAGEPTLSAASSYARFHLRPLAFVSSIYSRAFVTSAAELTPVFKRCEDSAPIDEDYLALLGTLQLIDETEGAVQLTEVHEWLSKGEELGTPDAVLLSDAECSSFKENFNSHQTEVRAALRVNQQELTGLGQLPLGYKETRAVVRNTAALLVSADLCKLTHETVQPFKEAAVLQSSRLIADGFASATEIAGWQAQGVSKGNQGYSAMGLDACGQLRSALDASREQVLTILAGSKSAK
jgi:hypothetical protein